MHCYTIRKDQDSRCFNPLDDRQDPAGVALIGVGLK